MIDKIYVTNAHKSDLSSIELAKKCSDILNVPYLPREKSSLKVLAKDQNDTAFLVVTKNKEIKLLYGEQELFFHPSMSKVRIKNIRRGNNDPMLKAMDIKEGDSVLDCTLGLGTDAIIASYAVGPTGKVVGLEAVPALALIVKYGLENYTDTNKIINEVMRRIEVINANHLEFLEDLPDNSFDIVYFDPMFRKPIHKSSSMEPMREWVNKDPLTKKAVEVAKRVAAKSVVMKENSHSDEFYRLGFSSVIGGKHSPIAYGVINTNN